MDTLPEELIRKIYQHVYDYVIQELIEKQRLINHYERDCVNIGCHSSCPDDSDFCSEYCENEFWKDYYQDLSYNSYYDDVSQSFVYY